MAANFLGLLFFIIGSTGISNALSLNEFFERSKRSSYFPHRFSDEIQSFRDRPDIFCLSRFSPIACKFMKYPRWQNPYFRQGWPFQESSWEVTDDSYEAPENSIYPLHNSVQRHYVVSPLNNIWARQVPESSPQSDIYSKSNVPFSSSVTANLEIYLHGTSQKILSVSSKNIPSMEIIPSIEHLQTTNKDSLELQYKSSPFEKNENIPKRDLITTDSTTLSTDGKSGSTISPIEVNFSQERLNKPNEENLQTRSTILQESSSVISTETTLSENKSSSSDGIKSKNNESSEISPNDENFEKKSTVFQDSSSVVTGEKVPLDNKSSSADGIQSTSIRNSDLESTSQNPSFSITDEDISSTIKSSSSEDIHPNNTQTFETESIITQSSSTMTSDDTAFHSKSSSSFETESTTAKILETDSTVKHFTSSKIIPISFTDKSNEGSTQETFPTESSSVEIHSTSGGAHQDHIIEIPSIRTARIVITSIFLVIALIALTVLAVYIFRMRRREVQYDQLMLIS